MSAPDHLPSELREAVLRGRAIPLLADYRPPELPDHTLTVFGLLDGVHFEGVFLPDGYSGEPLARIPIPQYGENHIAELKLESKDAQALHELWSRWNSGVHEDYLRFTRTVAISVAICRLEATLDAATTAELIPSTTAPKTKASKRSTAGTKKRRPRSSKPKSASS